MYRRWVLSLSCAARLRSAPAQRWPLWPPSSSAICLFPSGCPSSNRCSFHKTFTSPHDLHGPLEYASLVESKRNQTFSAALISGSVVKVHGINLRHDPVLSGSDDVCFCQAHVNLVDVLDHVFEALVKSTSKGKGKQSAAAASEANTRMGAMLSLILMVAPLCKSKCWNQNLYLQKAGCNPQCSSVLLSFLGCSLS